MNTYTLWENDSFVISTPTNPHIPYTEGPHIIVSPKRDVASAWVDLSLSAETFRLASHVCQIMEQHEFAPWFNIQANGNWGLLPGGKTSFHVHILGRKKQVVGANQLFCRNRQALTKMNQCRKMTGRLWLRLFSRH